MATYRFPAIIVFLSSLASFAADTVHITPDMDVAAAMQANTASGTIFYAHSGLYRGVNRLSIGAGQQFAGELGPKGERLAVFSGAMELKNWKKEGKYWVHDGVTAVGVNHGVCWKTYKRACAYPENLYLDDMFMREVETLEELETVIFDRMVYPHIGPYEQQDINQDLDPGTWYFDMDAGKIYMLDDPTGHKMEISNVKRFCSVGANAVLKNIVVEKYANQLQTAAVGVGGINGLVENVEARLNHGIGIAIYGGQSTSGQAIRNCYIHHNGQLGIKLQGSTNALAEGNIICYNDLHRTIAAWFGEEGGIKVVSDNVNPTLRHNWVHHNWGKGLWFDGWTVNGTVEGNLCEKNAEIGIFLEIMDTTTDSAIIRYNISRRNGYCLWFYGTQISSSSSKNVKVYKNVVVVDETHDANAMSVIWQIDDGYRHSMGPWGNHWHHNDITFNGIGICEDRTEMGAGGMYMKYGLAISTWGRGIDTEEDKLKAYNAQKNFVTNCGVIFEQNSFHVPQGYDRASWYWPPEWADADNNGETDGQLMNWYPFEEFKQVSGQEVGSTIDNDVDTSGARAIVKLENMGASKKTIEALAGYLNLDPDNLNIRPDARIKKMRESVRNIKNAYGHISIRLPRGDTYSVALYDARGRRIIRRKIIVGEMADRVETINTKDLARGVYTLAVEGKFAGRTSHKLSLMGK